MYAVLYTVKLSLGSPPILFALMMVAASSINHYAIDTSPVVSGSGYIPLGEWWTAGFIMGIFFMQILFIFFLISLIFLENLP
jgi:DASS family divalent anion:Na+ symporter